MNTNANLRDFWEHKVKEVQQSGLSVAEWVRQNDEFTVHQVRYWIRKFKEESKSHATVEQPQSNWIPVNVDATSQPNPQMIYLTLPNDSRLEIPSGLDPSDLTNLLRAVNAL